MDYSLIGNTAVWNIWNVIVINVLFSNIKQEEYNVGWNTFTHISLTPGDCMKKKVLQMSP